MAINDVKWDIVGILHTDKRISPLPAESRVITEIFQTIIIKKLQAWADNKNLNLLDNAIFGRGYPDITLMINSNRTAIDVKSSRIKNGDRISRMALGTYNGYFLNPNEKKLHKNTLCYNDYNEHWVIGVIYDWHTDFSE